jgi:hypothetical protein
LPVRRADAKTAPALTAYRDEAGREHARHFDRKVDAHRWLDEVTTSVVTGTYVDPRAGKVTFRDCAAEWLAMQPLRPDGPPEVRAVPPAEHQPAPR